MFKQGARLHEEDSGVPEKAAAFDIFGRSVRVGFLDEPCDRRSAIGKGAGGVGFDSTVFGQESLSRAQLTDRLAEFVELLERLFREPVVSHEGTYYSVHEACVQPASVQVPRVPLAIVEDCARC